MKIYYQKFSLQKLFPIILFCLSASVVLAQTNDFTYQGKLNDGAVAANGNYDFQFELHNALISTTPLATVTRTNVLVTNGIFTVRLDFPSALFDGTDRFLRISIKLAGNPNPFTPLAPYQQITSAPYAIKSLNAETATNATHADLAANSDRLGGDTPDKFVQINDSRLSDERTPLPGSPNYVQNTTSPQTASNFNISGSGTANVFNAATQYNIGGNRAFTAVGGGLQNVFAGLNAGTANTTGFGNTFVGNFSGNANTTGANNSFFGADSGHSTTGDGNSFFGRSAGFATTIGVSNAFFGLDSGRFNVSGSNNAFFGKESGFNNTADSNAFFGYRSGYANTSGQSNAFFGNGAGQTNITGNFNAFFGNQAGNLSTGTSNSFFGNNAGIINSSGGNNAFFGTIAGQSNTTGNNNTFYGAAAGSTNTTGGNNTMLGFFANVGSNNLNFATAIGSGATVSTSNTIALGRSDGSDTVLIPGTLSANLPAGDADYVQNRTTQQSSTSFNISGSGTASVFNATAQYNINNNRILSIAGTNNLFVGSGAGSSNSGSGNTFIGTNAGSANTTGNNNILIGSGANVVAGVSNSIAIGNNKVVSTSNTLDIGASTVNISGSSISLSGNVDVLTFKVNTLGVSGSTAICTNAGGFFSTCSSSLRYKTNVRNFNGGLEMLRRFRPVTFDWKSDGKNDVGFIAEEVNEIEPLLTTHNANGDIEGVKYAQITTVLVNAVNQQQSQIEAQQKQIEKQQQQIETLKTLVCLQNPSAKICSKK